MLHGPPTPKVWNYRGYATRKLGRLDEGIGYYLKSVSLDPHYAAGPRISGEAYVVKGVTAREPRRNWGRSRRSAARFARNTKHLAVAIAGKPEDS